MPNRALIKRNSFKIVTKLSLSLCIVESAVRIKYAVHTLVLLTFFNNKFKTSIEKTMFHIFWDLLSQSNLAVWHWEGYPFRHFSQNYSWKENQIVV